MMSQDAEATQNDTALNEWQIEEITKGVAEAVTETPGVEVLKGHGFSAVP